MSDHSTLETDKVEQKEDNDQSNSLISTVQLKKKKEPLIVMPTPMGYVCPLKIINPLDQEFSNFKLISYFKKKI